MKAGKSFLKVPLVSLGEGVRMSWEKKALLCTQSTFCPSVFLLMESRQQTMTWLCK